MLGTLEKAARMLDLFTPARPEWGVSEVARALAVPTSSAHLTLSSLAQTGLLHRTLSGRYRLGFKLLSLCQTLLTNTPWRDVAHEEMARLAQRSGENVGLAAFDGGQVVHVDGCAGRLGGAGPARTVGEILPAHASASGKVLLASRPWKLGLAMVQAAMQGGELPRYTENTITALDELEGELARVRRRGYAHEVSEVRAGVYGVAAPVRNHNGEVIAALSLGTIAVRFEHQKELQREVLHSAAEVSGRIGYGGGMTRG